MNTKRPNSRVHQGRQEEGADTLSCISQRKNEMYVFIDYRRLLIPEAMSPGIYILRVVRDSALGGRLNRSQCPHCCPRAVVLSDDLCVLRASDHDAPHDPKIPRERLTSAVSVGNCP